MTRHIHTRIVAALLATILLVGTLAAPAAAGLPDPPDRPNNHGAKSGVGDVYDGSVFVLRTKDKTVTETKTWKIPCGQKRTVSVTHENEYGMSLSGPLGGAEMNGVQQAAGDLRPNKRSTTKQKTVDLPPGNRKATLKHTAEYRHVHYKVYVQRQAVPARNELIGYVHIKTFEKATWNLKNPCGGGGLPPVITPNRQQPPVGPNAGKRRFADLAGDGTVDEATVLLSERFEHAEVPDVAKGLVAAKRINVEVDGGTIGMRTDDDGTPVSVRTQPYENPGATVTVDDETLRELERAADPVARARTEIAQGRIEYSSSDPVRQAAFYTAEAGLRCASFARGVVGGVGSFARGIASGL